MDLFKPDLILKQLNGKCLMCNGFISIRNRDILKYVDCYYLIDCLECQLSLRFNDTYFHAFNDILFLYIKKEYTYIEIISYEIDVFTGYPNFYIKTTFEQWIESFKKIDLETSIKVLNRFSENYMFM